MEKAWYNDQPLRTTDKGKIMNGHQLFMSNLPGSKSRNRCSVRNTRSCRWCDCRGCWQGVTSTSPAHLTHQATKFTKQELKKCVVFSMAFKVNLVVRQNWQDLFLSMAQAHPSYPMLFLDLSAHVLFCLQLSFQCYSFQTFTFQLLLQWKQCIRLVAVGSFRFSHCLIFFCLHFVKINFICPGCKMMTWYLYVRDDIYCICSSFRRLNSSQSQTLEGHFELRAPPNLPRILFLDFQRYKQVKPGFTNHQPRGITNNFFLIIWNQ